MAKQHRNQVDRPAPIQKIQGELVEDRPNQQGQLVAAARMESFSGPLPHPDMLRRYEEILPGSTERIFKIAESQSEHRQTLEKAVVTGNITAQSRGQWMGFLLGALTIGGGFWLISTGHDAYGIATIITAVAGLAGVFIYGRKQQEKERTAKRNELPQPLARPRDKK